MSTRCNCIAKTTNRVCKKSFSFIINHKKYCYIHARLSYNNFAITIQKVYKGWRQRKLLNIIYKKLPDDIQRKISWYVREPHYIKKYHATIQLVLIKKVAMLSDTLTNYYKSYQLVHPSISQEFPIEVINVYNLYNKYSSITNSIADDALYNISNKILGTLFHNINYHSLDNEKLDNINSNIMIIKIFRSIYNKMYKTEHIMDVLYDVLYI
jgi:hypothetical protein